MADLFGAITDDAVNRILNFLHARAPYLFNYVAPTVRFKTDDKGRFAGFEDVWLVCSEVPEPPKNVPKYRRIPGLSLPGVSIKLPCSIQVIDLNFDFHPSNTVTLPPELGASLSPQRFAIEAIVQFGLACIPPAAVAQSTIPNTVSDIPGLQLPVLPVKGLLCSLLKIYAIGHFKVDVPTQKIGLEVDGLEIVDIKPEGLENVVECYLKAMLSAAILPDLTLALQKILVNAIGITSITPKLTAGLPFNPAIEQNEARVWLDLAFA
jgi:hypothetical protein